MDANPHGRSRVLPLAALAAALAVALLPLVRSGFPAGHDWPFELVRAAQWRASLEEGRVPPDWAPDLEGGLGSPIFLFYAPLFSALTVALGALSGGIARGAASAVAVSLVLGAAATWCLASRVVARVRGGPPRATPDAPIGAPLDASSDAPLAMPSGAAAIAAIVWTLSPYVLGDAYLRNADAELLGLALAPLPLAGALDIDRRPRRATLEVALGLALVVLAHNLTALVVAALICWLGIALHAGRPGGARALLRLAGASALGVALAAFFWLPALSMISLVRPESLVAGKFDFRVQFPEPARLVTGTAFYRLGLVPAAALAAGLALAAWRLLASRGSVAPRGDGSLAGDASPSRGDGPRGGAPPAPRGDGARGGDARLAPALLGAAALSAALLFPASTPVWQALPFLPLFQFPWRFTGVLTLAAAPLAALAADAALAGRPAGVRRAAIVGVLLAGLLDAGATLAAARGIPAPRAALEAALGRDAVRGVTQSATVMNEYFPRGADLAVLEAPRLAGAPIIGVLPATAAMAPTSPAPPTEATGTSAPAPAAAATGVPAATTPATLTVVTVLEDVGTRITLDVRLSAPARLELARLHFPGWSASVDGAPLAAAASSRGAVLVAVPEGAHRVAIAYGAPPPRRAGIIVSLAALLVAAALALAPRRRG